MELLSQPSLSYDVNVTCFLFLPGRPLTKEDKLNSRIQDLKEKNASLSKVNSQLQEELKTVSQSYG